MSSSPIFESIALALAPDPYITIDEWADKYRQLPRGASAESGQYSTARMPYLREIMRELSPQSPTQQVKVKKGTQVGLTEVANNLVMYFMDVVPTSQIMVFASEPLAKDHHNSKLEPSLKAMPSLANKILPGKAKDDVGSTFEKRYPGGSLKLRWSGSTSTGRSASCRIVVLDDVDGFKKDVNNEGDTLDNIKKRADSFGILKKIYINSTPTELETSFIHAEFEDSDQRHYYMPCPHCKGLVTYEKDSFKFNYDKKTYTLIGDVQLECKHCGSLIDEHYKTWMEAEENGATWVPHNPGHIYRGYYVPGYLSPVGFVSWNEIFREFLVAKKEMKRGSVNKMKTWVNARDAMAWEGEMETVKVENLPSRCEQYNAEVPQGVLVLAAGVDTQNNRFEVEVVGYGRAGETWSIDYQLIHGDPNDIETRQQLATYLNRTFECEDGAMMQIYAKGVDTGGHRTKAAYTFCKPRYRQKVFAIKGSSTIDAPFINKRATITKDDRVNLFLVGVNAGKDEIYSNLEINEPGPRYMHFPKKENYDEEYFRQLMAEKRDKKTGGWVKYRHRNEAVDCRNYANAALQLAGIDEKILNLGRRIGIISYSSEKKPQITPKKSGRRIISRGI